MRHGTTPAPLSLHVLLFLLPGVAGLAGCASPERPGRPIPEISFRPDVPLEGARDRLREARELDPTLRLGFYSVAAPADGSDPARDDLVRTVAPGTWSRPGCGVERDGGWLVVIQTPDVHRAIAPWAAARKRSDLAALEMIQTEVRILTFRGAAAPVLARLGWEALPGEGASRTYIRDDDDVASLLEHDDVTPVHAPRLTTHDGQRGSISILHQQAFVHDYEIYQVDDDLIADPVIETVQDGISVEVRASLRDLDRVELEATTHLAELEGVEEHTIELSPDLDPVTIEVPRVKEWTIESRALLASGRALLAEGPAAADGVSTWVLIRVERVHPAREEAPR